MRKITQETRNSVAVFGFALASLVFSDEAERYFPGSRWNDVLMFVLIFASFCLAWPWIFGQVIKPLKSKLSKGETVEAPSRGAWIRLGVYWGALVIMFLAGYFWSPELVGWEYQPIETIEEQRMTGEVVLDDKHLREIEFFDETILFFNGTAPFRLDEITYDHSVKSTVSVATNNRVLFEFADLLRRYHLTHPFLDISPRADGSWVFELAIPPDLSGIEPLLQLDWMAPPGRIITNTEYTRQVVVLDGTQYENCHFVECTFRFFGISPFRLNRNYFHGDQALEVVSLPNKRLVQLMKYPAFDFLKPDVELYEMETGGERRGLRIARPVIERED